ncbi:hypothetical protein ABZX34_23315 [Streptomyces sp. NPDC004362]
MSAKTPDRPARRLRRRLSTRLLIDVIITHCPDTSGQMLLDVT